MLKCKNVFYGKINSNKGSRLSNFVDRLRDLSAKQSRYQYTEQETCFDCLWEAYADNSHRNKVLTPNWSTLAKFFDDLI